MNVDWQKIAFSMMGGLGLFLIGMNMMSAGLKEVAGRKLKAVLESMTRRPLMGFAMGTLVTALIQSSSAMTVMLIGLVNAGLMTVRQAICVAFGANVGTTATAWIVSLTQFEGFKITEYALPTIAVGFLMQVLGRTRKARSSGAIVVGLSMLFIGLGFMEQAFGGLEQNPRIVEWLASMGGRPMVAFMTGLIVTMIIQSSSASIAIFQMMAIGGAFGQDWLAVLNVAIPYMLGSDIGTTITAQIAALQTNIAAKRTAWAHTMFNVIGAAVAMPVFYTGLFTKAVLAISWWELGPTTILSTIAVANTLFKLCCSAVFVPLCAQVESLVVWMVRPRDKEAVMQPVVLEERLLDTPAIALEQSRREMLRMAKRAKQALNAAVDGYMTAELKMIDKARHLEDIVDAFQMEITSYLVSLSQRQLSDEVSVELPVLLHMVNDLERIGDHAVNIAEIAERKIEQKVTFSEDGTNDINRMVEETRRMFDAILAALEKNDLQAAHASLDSENKLNRMQVEFRRSHVQRMTDGLCAAHAGLIFIDMVDNLEKIGDHLTNIAQSIIGGIQWDGVDAGALSGEYKALGNDGGDD